MALTGGKEKGGSGQGVELSKNHIPNHWLPLKEGGKPNGDVWKGKKKKLSSVKKSRAGERGKEGPVRRCKVSLVPTQGHSRFDHLKRGRKS